MDSPSKAIFSTGGCNSNSVAASTMSLFNHSPARPQAQSAAGWPVQTQPSCPYQTWPGTGCPCPGWPVGCTHVGLKDRNVTREVS